MADCILNIRLTPRGSKNEILGWDGDTLRVKVTAPPLEGAANKACVQLVAQRLGVKRSQVTIVAGDKSRNKILRLTGVTIDEARQALTTSE